MIRNPVLFTGTLSVYGITEELHQELLRENNAKPGPLLISYADLSGITSCELL